MKEQSSSWELILERLPSLWQLLLWLGPWKAEQQSPSNYHWRTESWSLPKNQQDTHKSRTMLVDVFEPHHEIQGTVVVVQGLHFMGPGDPRMHRFCAILATSGIRVFAPYLSDFIGLSLSPTVLEDVRHCVGRVREFVGHREQVALFSISFGSLPALYTAAHMGTDIDGLITFGGYLDLFRTLRFCMTGEVKAPFGNIKLHQDPLNSPVLFLNLLKYLPTYNHPTTALEQAWKAMVYQTWGKEELKVGKRREPIALGLANSVPDVHRTLFMCGCGLHPSAIEVFEQALESSKKHWEFAMPSSHVALISCPVMVCHGRDDDVIPWTEAQTLYDSVAKTVPKRLWLTGMFGHTASQAPPWVQMFREGKTLLQMATALSQIGNLRAWLR
jgi:pimeloyl-ACP methyl ester carboxylesterase